MKANSGIKKFKSICKRYEPPGPISLVNLYESGGRLKNNLMEHHDYEVLPSDAWDYLVYCYGRGDKEKSI